MMYTGIAKGGPLDGQNIGHRSPVLHVNVRPPLLSRELPLKPAARSESVTFEVHSYTHDGDAWTWKPG